MRVLLTGADSLLGSSLANILVQNGFSVRALQAKGKPHPLIEATTLESVKGDLMDQESLHEALRGVQAVFHFSQRVALDESVDRWKGEADFAGTRNLLVAMSRGGVEDLVFCGSATSFGPGTIARPATESSPYSGDFGIPSIDSLRRSAELVRRFTGEGRIRGIIVAPTLVMGRGDTAGGPSFTLLECSAASTGEYPPGGVNVIHARDAAEAAFRALGRAGAGDSYILGGYNVPYAELIPKIASLLEDASTGPPAGERGRRSSRGAGSILSGLRRKGPAITGGMEAIGRVGLYYSNERASGVLDLKTPPLESILGEACAWFSSVRKGEGIR